MTQTPTRGLTLTVAAMTTAAMTTLVLAGCDRPRTVYPVMMAPYAGSPLTVTSRAEGSHANTGGATKATPVVAMGPSRSAAETPMPTTTPIAAIDMANMPVASTRVITVPTMVAPPPTPTMVAPPPAAAVVPATPVVATHAAVPVRVPMTAPTPPAPGMLSGPVMMNGRMYMMAPAQPVMGAAPMGAAPVATPATPVMMVPSGMVPPGGGATTGGMMLQAPDGRLYMMAPASPPNTAAATGAVMAPATTPVTKATPVVATTPATPAPAAAAPAAPPVTTIPSYAAPVYSVPPQ